MGKWENHRKTHRKMEVWPLVNEQNYGKIHHFFNGKIHYFDWAIFNSFFDIPRGYREFPHFWVFRISGEFLNGEFRLLKKLQTLALGNQDQYRLTSWCTIRDRQNATAPICEFNTRFGPGFHFSSQTCWGIRRPQTICSISNFGPHCPVAGLAIVCGPIITVVGLFEPQEVYSSICLETTLPAPTSWQCCSGRWTCSPHRSEQGFSGFLQHTEIP